jgi:hypothetical protein
VVSDDVAVGHKPWDDRPVSVARIVPAVTQARCLTVLVAMRLYWFIYWGNSDCVQVLNKARRKLVQRNTATSRILFTEVLNNLQLILLQSYVTL